MPDKPPGRPTEGVTELLKVRVAPAEYEFVKRASDVLKLSQSQFVRALIVNTLFDWNAPDKEQSE